MTQSNKRNEHFNPNLDKHAVDSHSSSIKILNQRWQNIRKLELTRLDTKALQHDLAFIRSVLDQEAEHVPPTKAKNDAAF